LGLGDRLVGVTRYCDYPPAATNIAKVGGYVDPSYEAIVALKPDLTILLSSHRDAKAQIEKLHLRTLTVPHATIQDIHEAIRLIGDACGEGRRADALLTELTKRAQAVGGAVNGKERPRVLICIGRDTNSGQLNGTYIAGRNGFYDQIIDLAGGVNVCADKTAAYPQLSAEGVIQLNPEVIIDLVSEMNPGKRTPKQIRAQWAQLGMVAAVRQGRVHVLFGDQALRPGPRYIEFLEQMARLLHKEAFAGGGSNE
jgi:iron complex transport system substrate-binding protein